jgi:hypothetical protein
MRKRIFLAGLVIASLSASFFSCDNNELVEKTAEPDITTNTITVKGVSDESGLRSSNETDSIMAFMDENIVSYNTATRELKFTGFDPTETFSYLSRLVFQMDNEDLFTATVVYPTCSSIIDDLVLQGEYDDDGSFRYFFRDAYPEWASSSETAMANEAARAEGWNRFIERLRETDRLIEDDVPPTPEPGEVQTIEYITENEWKYLTPNTLTVITSNVEMKNYITGDSIMPAIDFSHYILLVARINLTNTIDEISSKLIYNPEGYYTYSMQVTGGMGQTPESRTIAVLAPRVEYPHLTYFDLSITHLELERFNAYQWNPESMESNTLYVVRNDEEMKPYMADDDFLSSAAIDFNQHTLLLTKVVTNNGIHQIAYGLYMDDNGDYIYNMIVRQNETDVIGTEIVAVLAPKIEEDKNVRLDFSWAVEWEAHFN